MSKIKMFRGSNAVLRKQLEGFANKDGIDVRSAQLSLGRALVVYDEETKEGGTPNHSVDVRIAQHSMVDKSFEMKINDTYLYFDFDDVNHPKVEAMAKTLESIIKMNWDEDLFQRNWVNELKEQYVNLTPTEAEEYDHDFKKFLKALGCTHQ
jgi:hypothetical protein